MSRAMLRRALAPFLPLAFFEHQQLREAMGPFRDAGIAFVHIPRTAGLSITQAIYHRTVWCHFTLPQLLKHGDEDVLKLPRFVIIRNPWDRAVSAYHFAKLGGIPGGAQMRNMERYSGEDFETFDTFVRKYLAVRDVWKLDGVFRPQSYYLGPPKPDNFDYIGDFDYMPETEQWLSQTLGRPVRLSHSNATDNAKCRAKYRTYYSKETRSIVAEAYRCDIDRFGFQF
jgi:hypothetical protein